MNQRQWLARRYAKLNYPSVPTFRGIAREAYEAGFKMKEFLLRGGEPSLPENLKEEYEKAKRISAFEPPQTEEAGQAPQELPEENQHGEKQSDQSPSSEGGKIKPEMIIFLACISVVLLIFFMFACAHKKTCPMICDTKTGDVLLCSPECQICPTECQPEEEELKDE